MLIYFVVVVSELQYLDLGTNVMYLRMVDDSFSAPISVPGQIPVFGQVYSNVYVSFMEINYVM